jgi:hypothetical protein
MSRSMVRLAENPDNQGRKAARSRRLQEIERKEAAKVPFEKAFDDLTAPEKNDLLRRLAIMAGLVEE